MTAEDPLDLRKPFAIRAEMARRGFAPGLLLPYDDPDRGWVDPLDDQETKADVRGFMAEVWKACLDAEYRAKATS